MQCEEAVALFSDHVDGALTDGVEVELCAHVAACGSCRQALRRYEQGLLVLAGASPEPPGDLGRRLRDAALGRGLVEAPPRPLLRRLLTLAAAVATFALGAAVARYAPYEPSGPRPRTGDFVSGAVADPCLSRAEPHPWGDLDALRALPSAASQAVSVEMPTYRVRLPHWLTTRGPYDNVVSAATRSGSALCVPLRAVYGGRLALTVAPATVDAGRAFVVESDPARVLYGRVTWTRSGLAWSLEGRAEATELLALAHECAARAVVERI